MVFGAVDAEGPVGEVEAADDDEGCKDLKRYGLVGVREANRRWNE
jgi:hypothetical protein